MTAAATRRPVPDELFGGRLKGCYLLDLEVEQVVNHSSALRTITFTSTDLVGFTSEPGQDIMFEVPGSGGTTPRRYTIRRSDPAAGTLDIEVVLHGSGPFARWAAEAAVGDRIAGIGPRGVARLHDDATHHLFVGDESAVPATFAMLEALTTGSVATAVLVTEDALPLTTAPASAGKVELTWVGHPDLVERLQSTPLPPGTVAYVNGERHLVRAASELLAARGLPAEAMLTKAYWRRDQPNAAHGEPAKDARG